MTHGNGDYATIFASFVQSPAALAPHLRTARFRTLVDERRSGFVGRDFVFEAVDALLAREDFASGYVVIRGEPGIGKTAIASNLVARGAHVHHFNIAAENIRSARQFLENVSAQLILRYDLDHATLPPRAGEDSDVLTQLLQEAVDRARERRELPVVVVVDALDEAEIGEGNRLYLPRGLPPDVFFVVTTREEDDHRLDVDNAREIWIRDDDEHNRRDVATYVGRFVDAHPETVPARIAEWEVTVDEFVAQITALSEGNFMYLVHVLPEIAEGRLTRETVGVIASLPHGLDGYYKRHWRDMKAADPRRFEDLQRPVLCFLAISREPVSTVQLADWTALEPGDVAAVIEEWREFLNENNERPPPVYRIYHRSFAEFLDRREQLSTYHARISERALAKIPGFLDD